METIEIRGIWLLREGGVHDAPSDKAVVVVELPDGTLKRAIVESLDGAFSHYVHPEGIRMAVRHEL